MIRLRLFGANNVDMRSGFRTSDDCLSVIAREKRHIKVRYDLFDIRFFDEALQTGVFLAMSSKTCPDLQHKLAEDVSSFKENP